MLVDSQDPSYGNFIADWILGDDRQFIRQLGSLIAGDAPTDAWFTIKASPTDTDSQALVLVHITTTLGQNGQIVNTPPWTLNIHIFGNSIASALPWMTYWYDIKIATAPSGAIWTIENGTIAFQPSITNIENPGLAPMPLGNNGIPRFIGWIGGPPRTGGPYSVGDWGRNLNPQAGEPSGWTCIAAGAPGTWRTDGIVGSSDGT